jgi:chaperonin cofactor prefoldin
MWTVEQLEQEVAALAQQIDQSGANHHILVGKKMAVEAFLAEAKKAPAPVEVTAEPV